MTNEERFKHIYDVYEKWARSKGITPPNNFEHFFDAVSQVITERKINSASLFFSKDRELYVVDNDRKITHHLVIDIIDVKG